MPRPGRVVQVLAAAQIFDTHTDIVTKMRVVAMRGIGRRFAAQRHRGKTQVLDAIDHEIRASFQRHRVPFDAAIMTQHVEKRVAGGEVLVHHVGAINVERLAFAQNQQAGGMVDLAVDEDDADDARVAQGPGRLHGRKGLQLGANVGGGVEEHPIDAVATDGDGGLCAGRSSDVPPAQPITIRTVTVPLRESTAGGRSKDMYPHHSSANRKS